MWFSSPLTLSLLALAAHVDAAHVQISGRPRSTVPALQRRTSMSGTMSQLNDSNNLVYLTDVTLNNEPFSILVDTGSSDLWVTAPVPGAVPQGYQADVSYASGSASGQVVSATFDFAGFTIENQFFIDAPEGDAAAGADGLIGLGPSSSSAVRIFGNSSAANPPLDRIFASNSSLSPSIAILLQRSDDPDEPYPGDLAVGEVLSDHQDILNQPHLPVTLVTVQGNQHWQTLLDVNGIIGSNGKPIEIKTQVTGATTPNATIVFDTGFTLPQVPGYVAQALYADVPGAALTNDTDLGMIWTLPCDQQVNATFLFAGVEFPIHPLDLNFDGFNSPGSGRNDCVGAFQPYSFDIEQEGEIIFDMILGMAFLRNAYMLINFGDLVNAATPSTDTAYIQLLPITNATQASQDFTDVRSGDGSGTGNQLSSTDSKSSGLSPEWIGLIAGVGLLLVLVAAGVALCYRRRRTSKNVFAPSAAWVANPGTYQRINEPSPQAAYDIHMAPGAPPHAPDYRTAWDARY